MIRLTYKDALPDLARVAGAAGMSLADPRVMSTTNLAIRELMDAGDWASLVAWMRFKVTNRRINLPSEFDRILALKVNDVPMALQSPWFEFVGDGLGYFNGNFPPLTDLVGPLTWNEGVLDREQVATFQDIPSDGTLYYPQLYAGDPSDAGAGIILQGYDPNGNWIRSNNPTIGWQDGVSLTLSNDNHPFAQSPIPFSQVTGVQKDVTGTYVNLYASNNVVTPTFLCQYAPYDTNPFYRRYLVPNFTNSLTFRVDTRCRRRFVPIVKPQDSLLITNLPALMMMIQGVFYREAQDLQNYVAYKAGAVGLLKDEMKSYIGKQRQKPLITFGEGAGVRRDGMLIL